MPWATGLVGCGEGCRAEGRDVVRVITFKGL